MISRIGFDCAHAEVVIKLKHAKPAIIAHRGTRLRDKSSVFISSISGL